MKLLLAFFPFLHVTTSFAAQIPSEQDLPNQNAYGNPTIDFDASGISPWSDNGRSEMLDYEPIWRYCPRHYLDCRKCRRDPRCQHPKVTKESTTTTQYRPEPTIWYSGKPNSLPRPQLANSSIVEPTALSGPLLITSVIHEPAAPTQAQLEFSDIGPQIAHSGGAAATVADSQFFPSLSPTNCSLKRCSASVTGCHPTTTCSIWGYCLCSKDRKPVLGSRLSRVSEAEVGLRLYVDPETACDRPCEEESCSETVTNLDCPSHGPWVGGNGQKQESQVYEKSGLGAIQVPGANIDGPDLGSIAGSVAGTVGESP